MFGYGSESADQCHLISTVMITDPDPALQWLSNKNIFFLLKFLLLADSRYITLISLQR
jgi:hypothetical protein